MFTIPVDTILTFILVLIRVFFLISFLPVYGDPFTPVRVRTLLTIPVALVFTPLVEMDLSVFPETIPQFVALMVPEAMLGMFLGFVGRLFFAAVQYGGALIGMEIGFQMANIIDPTQSAQTPVVGQVLFIGSLMIFLGINGDHMFFSALGQSFENAPPGSLSVPHNIYLFFNDQAARMFFIAVQLSLPVITVIFCLNVGMGMMGRLFPTMHIFLERFNIAIALGLFLLAILADFFIHSILDMIVTMKEEIAQLLRIMGA